MDGIGDPRIGPVASNHGWQNRHSLCRLLGNIERITEAPEQNPGAQGTLWCTRIVVISTESFVFSRNRFFGLAVDIWVGNLADLGEISSFAL